jgi:hypothetical protein
MNKTKAKQENSMIEALLRDLLITSLSAAGVKSTEIRKIAGCDMNKVTRIVKGSRKREKASGRISGQDSIQSFDFLRTYLSFKPQVHDYLRSPFKRLWEFERLASAG